MVFDLFYRMFCFVGFRDFVFYVQLFVGRVFVPFGFLDLFQMAAFFACRPFVCFGFFIKSADDGGGDDYRFDNGVFALCRQG